MTQAGEHRVIMKITLRNASLQWWKPLLHCNEKLHHTNFCATQVNHHSTNPDLLVRWSFALPCKNWRV